MQPKTRYALIDAWDATPLMLNGLFGSAPMMPCSSKRTCVSAEHERNKPDGRRRELYAYVYDTHPDVRAVPVALVQRVVVRHGRVGTCRGGTALSITPVLDLVLCAVC